MDIWVKICEEIKRELGPQIFARWFEPTRLISYNDGTVTIGVPDAFFKDWLSEHYLPVIQKAVQAVLEKSVTIELTLAAIKESPLRSPLQQTHHAPSPSQSPVSRSASPTLGFYLNPRYTFDSFVIGTSNRFAHAASVAVADSPARAYNPLYIYGGVGLGKTHLMQAIGHHVLQTQGSHVKIYYISSEGFTNQLISSIQTRTTVRFRERYRSVDILLIDDIQFISGKESTQEEFFHTFNALFDAHKQIIISSDRPPKDISGLEERLVSRFEWGLVTDIQPPDLETRIAILRKKAEREVVAVPDDVLFFLAENIKANIRELEGALIRIVAFSSLTGEAISIHLAKDVLRDMLKEQERLITIQAIQEIVSDYFGLAPADLKAKRRTKQIVFPRQVSMYLVRLLTNHSLNEIGASFGGRDHSTVIHAYDKIDQQLKVDNSLRSLVEELSLKIKS